MAKSLEVVLIKKPNSVESYTEQQIKEIAKCADPKTGPQYFLDNYFYIQHPTRGRMLYQPFEYQKRLVDTYHGFRYSISLIPGKQGNQQLLLVIYFGMPCLCPTALFW